jgi:hypothetical protein
MWMVERNTMRGNSWEGTMKGRRFRCAVDRDADEGCLVGTCLRVGSFILKRSVKSHVESDNGSVWSTQHSYTCRCKQRRNMR